MIKNYRQATIKNIIENNVVETQDDLAKALRKRGIKATQATISRDVKDLMLLKLPLGNGHSRYAFPRDERLLYSDGRATRILQDSILDMRHSENILVIKTLAGAANGVAALLDNTRWPEIVGTVAGYDTVMVVAAKRKMLSDLVKKIEGLAYKSEQGDESPSESAVTDDEEREQSEGDN